jgi:hypothetical protein
MREPEPYRMEIDVNWGAAVLLLPLILAVPDAWGTYFGAVAVALLIGTAMSAIKLW